MKIVLDIGNYRRALPQKPPTAIDQEVNRFDKYMRLVAGLQESTRKSRRQYLREFLTEALSKPHINIPVFTPATVNAYMMKRSQRGKPASSKDVANGLRSYFRFREFCGEQNMALRLSVPSPIVHKFRTLPKVLSENQIIGLLSVFDRRTAVGCRDYAITRCLLDLGLRPREVARLKLDDINWRESTIRIIGTKSRRDSQLPLPATTAKAIADYLVRVRVTTSNRNVFLHINAPAGQPIGRQTVSGVVRRAGLRVPIDTTIGARTLRQTAASRMVCRGASLKDVADVLRHRKLDTTMIYAKVDLAQLADVAAPWPQGGSL